MKINYTIDYELTEEEATKIKTLLKFESKEETADNIEQLLKELLESYLGTDIFKYSTFTKKQGVEGLLEEAVNIEYNTESFHRDIEKE